MKTFTDAADLPSNLKIFIVPLFIHREKACEMLCASSKDCDRKRMARLGLAEGSRMDVIRPIRIPFSEMKPACSSLLPRHGQHELELTRYQRQGTE